MFSVGFPRPDPWTTLVEIPVGKLTANEIVYAAPYG